MSLRPADPAQNTSPCTSTQALHRYKNTQNTPTWVRCKLLLSITECPLWLDLQSVDIKSRWRHNWKSAQVFNSHLVCNPHNLATGFRRPSATVVSAEPFSHGTGTLQCLQKEMATYCVAVACAVACLDTSWLWQCNTGWSEWTVDGATSVCSVRRCSADLLQTEVRAHNATAQGTALVVCPWAQSVQTCGARFFVVSMVLLRHTLLTSCSRWQPWSHAEGCDPRPRHSARLDIPRVRRTTIGDRAFCVAGPRVWNSLSSSTQSAPSLLVFRQLLKCELFRRCYDLC